MEHNYFTNLSKHFYYDFYVAKLSLYYDEDNHDIGLITCDSSDWGVPSSLTEKTPEKQPLPMKLEMRWYPFMGHSYYVISEPLDQAKADEIWQKQQSGFPDSPFNKYLIGIAPHGKVAVWLCNRYKSVLLHWLQAKEIPLSPELEEDVKLFTDPEKEAIVNATLTPEKLQSQMRQHNYRFIPLEEFFDGAQWQRYDNGNFLYENIDLEGVEVKRLDGTFDYTDNDELLSYHEAGKPQRISVNWKEGEASYFAHFWLDETEITSAFDDLFDKVPEAKAELLVRLDTRANRYEVAMKAQNMPSKTFVGTQFIIFKNHEEISRSQYFDKEDDSWYWK